MIVVSCPRQQFILALAMARVKNARGGPGDKDPRPLPRLSAEVKGNAKKTMTKKHKFVDADTERAAAVAAAVERVEREEGLRVVFVLQISFHQLRGPPSRALSVFMVV